MRKSKKNSGCNHDPKDGHIVVGYIFCDWCDAGIHYKIDLIPTPNADLAASLSYAYLFEKQIQKLECPLKGHKANKCRKKS